MGLLLFVPGLILLLAGSGWFDSAHTVGLILTVVGGVLLAIQTIWVLFVGGLVVKGFRDL